MTAIAFSSAIGPIVIDCLLSEKHVSGTEITDNPIETGADIHDHVYVMPKQVTLEIANESAAEAYRSLVDFQEDRAPFTLVSGLAVYPNMLVKSITADRDKTFSEVLRATIDLQEVTIANTATAPVDVGDAGAVPSGQPGGTDSTNAASPSSERSGDAATQDRATGTVQRGDARAKTVSPADSESVLRRLLRQ